MATYNTADLNSILTYAKLLRGKCLRDVCDEDIINHGYSGKGNFGQILEKYYFGYEPNSVSEPDFHEVNLELKASPLKKLKNGEYRSKERLVLSIIDYLSVHKETFEESSFWKKNSHLLLVFYLHDSQKLPFDLIVKLVDEWKFPPEDLIIIRNDWELIKRKVKQGRAHELSEGDTLYLGACTKGSTALKSLREQPYNKLKAKQRAYSLKGGYVNHIIAKISESEKDEFGKLLNTPKLINTADTLKDVVLKRLNQFVGLSGSEIEKKLNINVNANSKQYYSQLLNAMLGLKLEARIEEFEKANIQVKAIRVEENEKIIQSVSFPAFKFVDVYNESWISSEMKDIVERKFLFIFFKKSESGYKFEKAKFWNMPYMDRNEVRRVWLKTKHIIQKGRIFKEYMLDKNGQPKKSIKGNFIKRNFFPKIKDSNVCHVRPHGADSTKTYPLPVLEKKLKVKEYSKQCFWLNADYVRDNIYSEIDKRTNN